LVIFHVNQTNMKVELNSENIQKIFDISIVLSKVLEHVFDENRGIVLYVPTEIKSFSDTKKIVVYKKDGAIQISSIDKDIKEGTLIEL